MPVRPVTFRFARFAVVGSLGFCVDGGLLTLLTASGWDILWARSCSFSSAVTVTWLLNRCWTFQTGYAAAKKKQYLAYFLTQAAGAGINLSLFFALVGTHPLFRSVPLIPLAAGAGVSLIFTFLVSKHIVFRSDPSRAVSGTGRTGTNGRFSRR